MMTLKDYLNELQDEMILSSKYQQLIEVKGIKVISRNKIIDIINTELKAKILYEELFDNTFASVYM